VALQASTSVGYRLADRRIGVSGGVVDDIARLSHMRRSVFEVINNPVPMRSPPPAATLAAVDKLWGVPHGKRIVTVGSLKAQKNHLLLLQAFAKIGASDARLMLVGDGSGKPVLIELAKELGVGDQVIFAGFQPDPTPFYVSADLFVLSSDHEGLPTVLIESLACGTPVVSTDCPSGPSEILDHGRYGRLVPVRDPDALSQAMTESLAVSHDKSALVERARYFSTDRAVQAYLSAFGIGNG
jgi:glycosyltransferase involved in cell wall biosynthesis